MTNYFQTLILAAILSIGQTFCDARDQGSSKLKSSAAARVKSAPGAMQVDQPAADATVLRESKASKAQRAKARGLTAEQKNAFRVRKEKMDRMIALITEKRRALQAAKPEERAGIARELHSMILERDPDVITPTGQTARLVPPEQTNPPAQQNMTAPVVPQDIDAVKMTKEQFMKLQRQKLLDQKGFEQKRNRP